MASRKSKDAVRLERGEAEGRVFWEISRNKATITTRFGRHLSAGRTIVKEHESPAAAARTFDKAIEDKRKEGYSQPLLRAEVGATSRKGVSARSPELEALVDEAPGDPERYLVYADWLQQQGDPRGELIVVQHRLATIRDAREISLLERDHAALFRKFEAELLGPLAKYVFLRSSYRSYRTFSWRCGFIRAARLSRLQYRLGESVSAVLAELLAHPSGRFLERLIIGGHFLDGATRFFDVLREHAPPTLVSLVLGDEAYGPARLDPLWSSLPRLLALELTSAHVSDFGAVRADSLRVLRLGSAGHDILGSLARSAFPSLEALHLTLPLRESGPLIAEILRGDAAPTLAQLTARRWIANEGADGSYVLVPQDVLAIAVARAAAARKLARLDLEMPLGDEGAAKLVASAGELRAIGELHIPAEGVAPALRSSLSSALPRLTWTESPEEAELEIDEIDESPAPWARPPAAPLSSRAEPR